MQKEKLYSENKRAHKINTFKRFAYLTTSSLHHLAAIMLWKNKSEVQTGFSTEVSNDICKKKIITKKQWYANTV